MRSMKQYRLRSLSSDGIFSDETAEPMNMNDGHAALETGIARHLDIFRHLVHVP